MSLVDSTARRDRAIGGITNFLNNMMGVVAPVATGYMVGATHSFAGAFLVAGFMLLAGIISFVFVLGRVEPIADPPTAGLGLGVRYPRRKAFG